MAAVVNTGKGGTAAATLTGIFTLDQTITATLPAGVIGTLQFTRSTIPVPPAAPVKTPISGAVANAVNSLTYQIQAGDVGFVVGCDASNQVTPAVGVAVSAYVPVTKLLSASTRGKIPFTTGQFSTAFPVKYYRGYDKSNVAVANPRPTILHGYVVGVTGEERGCNPTLPSTTTVAYEYSQLRNITGRGEDQSGATLVLATFNLTAADADFIAAGGSVTGGGYVANVPEGWKLRPDPMPALAAGEAYFHQLKIKGANLVRHPANISSHATGMGDLIYNAAGEAGPGATGDLIRAKNWTGVPAPSKFGAILAPWMVLGDGDPSIPVFGINGDSIENGVAGDATLALTSEDLGDADGVQNYAKRGLNMAGKSFIDASVSGSNIRNMRDSFPATQNGWRMQAMQLCDHVFTGLGKNDRSSGHSYYDAAGLGTLTEWMTTLLRSKIKPGGKVYGFTFPPATNCTVANTAITSSGTTATATTGSTANMVSGAPHTIASATPAGFNQLNAVCTVIGPTQYTYQIADLAGASASVPGTWADGWKTEANQTPKNGDATWPSLGEAALTGQQHTYNDRTMRRGTYASLDYGGAAKEYDGAFDFSAFAQGTNGGLAGVNGTRYWKYDDGTHPKDDSVHVPAASAFAAQVLAWFPA
ncbi:hypothetical protein ACEN9F_13425 [Duganella sp. CT11-25]|uniref:hypothetical protein n=1 Tax=unclassified Duganella TaxID=2636909 RepID=UPI0039B04253